MNRLVLTVATLALLATPTEAPSQVRKDRGELTRTVDSIVTAMMKARGAPGASVLIAYGDSIYVAKGYGFAELDNDVLASPQTVYQVASITKQFAAAAILQLAKEGKLRLDDPAEHYLTDSPTPLQGATIRQLLNHTSGVRSPGALGDRWWSRRDYTRDEWRQALAEWYKTRTPLAAPGAGWAYANMNYTLLAFVIEKVTGRSYWEDFAQRFAIPLGMTSTAPCNPNVVQKRAARGYLVNDSTKVPAPAAYFTPTVSLGNAGLCSSVIDLFRWQRGLARHRVLDSATYAMMRTPDILNGVALDYALGVAELPVGEQKMSLHLGGAPGFTSFLGYLPRHDATVIIAGNANIDPLKIGAELARATAGVPQPVTQPMTAAQMARYVGTYAANGVKAVVRSKGDALEADITGTGTIVLGFPVRLMKQSDTMFLVDWEPQSRVIFEAGPATSPSITLQFRGRSLTLNR